MKLLGLVQFFIQGGFFNCSHPKISKYKKKPKYTNCSRGNSSEMSKYGKSQNIVTVPHCYSGNSWNTLFFSFFVFSGWEQFWYLNFFQSWFIYRLTLKIGGIPLFPPQKLLKRQLKRIVYARPIHLSGKRCLFWPQRPQTTAQKAQIIPFIAGEHKTLRFIVASSQGG